MKYNILENGIELDKNKIRCPHCNGESLKGKGSTFRVIFPKGYQNIR